MPDKFGLSYTILLLKGNTASMSKSLTASDIYRHINIALFFQKYLRIVFFRDINIFSLHQITNLVFKNYLAALMPSTLLGKL